MLGTHLSACPCPQAAKIAPRSQLMHSGPAWPPRPHSACHRSGLCCPWLMQIPLLGASPWSPTSHPSGTLSQSQTLVGGLLRLRGLCGCLKPPLHPAPPPPAPVLQALVDTLEVPMPTCSSWCPSCCACCPRGALRVCGRGRSGPGQRAGSNTPQHPSPYRKLSSPPRDALMK